MGRFLVFLGILAIFVGTAGIAYSIFAPIQNIVSSVMNVEEEGGRAESLCNDNETLRSVEGASTRNSSGTYGRPVSYYCVDAFGNEREVTGDFVQGVMGDTGSTIMSTLNNSLLWTGVIMGGVFFTIIGAIMGARKRMKQGGYMVTVNGQPIMMQQRTINVPDTSSPSEMMDMMSDMLNMASNIPMANAESTEAKLQKLDALYNKGVITREEYDRTRQKILDDIA